MLATVRGWVSKRKRRYKENGYNLDLAYITDHIIAMGAPSQGTTGLYRNPMAKVQKFLTERHGAGGYCVYNLCSEEAYAYKPYKFELVANFPFDDHQVPSLRLVQAFCEHVAKFLTEHPKGVAAVHCKAGKGRTGIMITCYLLYSGQFQDVQQALDFYATRRTHDGKGITNASQERYVHYFARAMRAWPQKRVVALQAVRMEGLGWISESNRGSLVLRCRPTGAPAAHKVATIHISGGGKALAAPWQLEGDIKLEVSRFSRRKKLSVLFSAWLHSSYLESGELTLTWQQLDKVAKLVPKRVELHLTFQVVPDGPTNGGHSAIS
ncbi:g8370 [Coccomyxa elongata]